MFLREAGSVTTVKSEMRWISQLLAPIYLSQNPYNFYIIEWWKEEQFEFLGSQIPKIWGSRNFCVDFQIQKNVTTCINAASLI